MATADGTAKAGSDYAALAPTTVAFAAGEVAKAVNVSVTGDLADEANETFSVVLSLAGNGAIADGNGQATIVDDEGAVTAGPATFLSVNDPIVIEGNANSTFLSATVTRAGDVSTTSTVTLSTANGSAIAGGDFTGIASKVSFAAGERTKPVSISVLGDTVVEPSETFFVSLAAPQGAVIADGLGTATIANDDATFLSVNDVTAVEGGAGTATGVAFTLTRTGSLGGPSSVTVATANSSAVAGTDYGVGAARKVDFAAGETSKTVTVSIIGDGVFEADEAFLLRLSAATGATIADTEGTATIRNDDAATYLSVGDPSLTEGDAGAANVTFNVARTGNLAGASSVTVAASTGTATAGSDYTALAAKIVSFAAGESFKAVQVPVLGDRIDEGDETVVLTLSAASGASLADASGTATIIDNDGPTYVSINDAWIKEGSEVNAGGRQGYPITFLVTRSGQLDASSTVTYTPIQESAVDREDFVGGFGSKPLTFAAGEAVKSVTLIVWSDDITEDDETFRLALSAPVGATLSDASGTATIADDD